MVTTPTLRWRKCGPALPKSRAPRFTSWRCHRRCAERPRAQEEHRQAFLLFHEQELSYAEIAAAMDCPVGTIKTWIHRARGLVVRQLRERGVVEEARHALPRV